MCAIYDREATPMKSQENGGLNKTWKVKSPFGMLLWIGEASRGPNSTLRVVRN